MDGWSLPTTATIGGTVYQLHTDYRDVLDIMRQLTDEAEPEYIRWTVAVALFYEDGEAMPQNQRQEAMTYLAAFIAGPDAPQQNAPAPKLLDWEQDAGVIVASVNKVAGCEVRALPYLHWWTFLAYFACIGDGALATLVAIRDKLRRGKKLEKWEREYYREHKAQVDLRRPYTAEEIAERERLKQLLGE